MNLTQRFQAIQAIKQYARIQHIIRDSDGNVCAYGALLVAAGIPTYVLYRFGFFGTDAVISETEELLKEKYGLTNAQLSEIVTINDTHSDPLVRRQKLCEYLESLPLETETIS